MKAAKKNALVIVDCQNDFCEGGSLAIPGAVSVVLSVNELRKNNSFDYVFLTCDWHPEDHISFAVNHPGGKPYGTVTLPNGKVEEVWPVHCVQNQKGAEFHKDLVRQPTDIIIKKGFLKDHNGYSGFGACIEKTGLVEYLQEQGVEKVFVCGLALDFCVKNTAIDGAKNG